MTMVLDENNTIMMLDGDSLTTENVKAACRRSANKKGASKKGIKRILWVERFATVTKRDGVILRGVRFFVEGIMVRCEMLCGINFKVDDKVLIPWLKIEFLPIRSLAD